MGTTYQTLRLTLKELEHVNVREPALEALLDAVEAYRENGGRIPERANAEPRRRRKKS